MEEFRFARVFRAGMILQRDCPFTVWGFGAVGEVAVYCRGKEERKVVCRALPDGSFRAEFPAVAGGEERYILSAECEAGRAEVANVRFGDVYLLLGQSNMSYPLAAIENRKRWLRRAAAADVAFLPLTEPPFSDISEVTRPVSPLNDLSREYSYVYADAEKIAGVSAIGAMAAVFLAEKSKVPVGMVDTSMGGLSVEAYLPREYVESDAELKEYLKKTDRYVSEAEYNRCGGRNFTQLSGVYNEKVAPLDGLRFRAMVWYLGESSAFDLDAALYFERELRLILHHYRRMFGEIPFVAVQLATEYYPYGDRCGLMYVNESLDRLAREERDCFALPVYAVEPRWLVQDGELYYHPIHPVNKEPVAAALAKILYKNAICGEHYAFPRIRSVYPEGGALLCEVEDAGAGFASRFLYGFSVCGEDGKYYTAEAEAVGRDRIRLSSPQVARPVNMTYAFVPDPEDCDAALKTGESLLPYRTRRESVRRGYDPLPHWLLLQRKEVSECCFGWSVGIQRRVPRWEKGRIYGNACKIEPMQEGECGVLKLTARPRNAGYYFFGASPRVCLSGHRSGLADYPYLRAEIGASVQGVEFYGVAVRLASGEIFRFAPRNDGAAADSLPLSEGHYSAYCISLEQAFREDSVPVTLEQAERDRIVEAEFLFRSKEPCTVYLRKLSFLGAEEKHAYAAEEKQAAGAAMQLPSTH